MKPLGDSHLIERGNSLKNNNIFLRIKQFIQKNKCNLYKKTIFLCKIAVALRMECVDLSFFYLFIPPTPAIVALRMECVDLSSTTMSLSKESLVALRMECVDLSIVCPSIFANPPLSHSVWSAWI